MKKYPIRCPITSCLSVIEGHWKPIILWVLRDKPLRYKEIAEYTPDISTKVLTDQLKELEQDKLIVRNAFAEIPPRVEYALTERGRTLLPVLQSMRVWGFQYMQENPQILHPESTWIGKTELNAK